MTDLVYDSREETGEELRGLLLKLRPEDNVLSFRQGNEILKYAGSHIYHAVFVCLYDEAEEELALSSSLVRMIPGVNLILVSADESNLRRALQMHASGYICLPVDEKKVEDELSNLLYPDASGLPVISYDEEKPEVCIDGRPVSFAYSKTAELFILLLKMKGAMVRNEKMMDSIFEEDKPEEKSRSYLQNLRSDLIHTLEAYGLDRVVCHRRGRMWLDRKKYIEDISQI